MVFELDLTGLPEPVRISVRPESTTVAAEHTWVFDGEGRLVTVSRDGVFIKRGLNGRMLAKQKRWTPGRREHVRHDLPGPALRAILAEATAAAARLLEALPSTAPPAVAGRLRLVASRDAAFYDADEARFATVYRPIGILPPDQYQALVLQATEGCHYNRCTFCRFYREMPFHIKSEAEFAAHLDAVLAFAGEGLGLRRSLFLADANALVVPQARLVPLLERLNERLVLAPPTLRGAALAAWRRDHPEGFGGIYSFLDAFTGTRKTVDDFARLASLGLRRIYVGMESGHEPLLRLLRKPSMPDAVRDVVATAHAGGVEVGVIAMIGIGGRRFAGPHVADTLALLHDLDLRAGDIVYLSEFVDEPGSEYGEMVDAGAFDTLPPEGVREQAAALRSGLRLPEGVKIATYDIREFVY